MDNGTKEKLFDKIDALKDEVHSIAKDVIEVRETQKRHYDLNAADHVNLNGEIAEIKVSMATMDGKIDNLESGHHEQESILHQRKGERRIFSGIFQTVLAIIGSGAVLGGIWWIVNQLLK